MSIISILKEPLGMPETIDCGIGEIRYFEPSSLVLNQLMEKFAEGIQKHGAAKVLAIFESSL